MTALAVDTRTGYLLVGDKQGNIEVWEYTVSAHRGRNVPSAQSDSQPDPDDLADREVSSITQADTGVEGGQAQGASGRHLDQGDGHARQPRLIRLTYGFEHLVGAHKVRSSCDFISFNSHYPSFDTVKMFLIA